MRGKKLWNYNNSYGIAAPKTIFITRFSRAFSLVSIHLLSPMSFPFTNFTKILLAATLAIWMMTDRTDDFFIPDNEGRLSEEAFTRSILGNRFAAANNNILI